MDVKYTSCLRDVSSNVDVTLHVQGRHDEGHGDFIYSWRTRDVNIVPFMQTAVGVLCQQMLELSDSLWVRES